MASRTLHRRKKRWVGQKMEVIVNDMAPGGWGVIAHNGQRIYVTGALPGDRIFARVVRQTRGRLEACVERFLSGALKRVAPRCEHFSICGGCLWQHIDYPDQLSLKKAMIVFCFREAGIDTKCVADVIGSEAVCFYRNKMDFTFGRSGTGQPALGLLESAGKTGWRKKRGQMPPVFDVTQCWLQSDAANRVVAKARRALRDGGFQPFDPETRSGTVRSLVVREGAFTGQMLVQVTTGSNCAEEMGPVADAIAAEGVEGVVWSVNARRSKNAAPRSQVAIRGAAQIGEEILGLKVGVSSSTFLQVNTRQAERLYEIALDLAGLDGTERVLDLYCGIGTLSMVLARESREVIGVEVHAQAVADAKQNADRNRIENCHFLCEDVLEFLDKGELDLSFDVVIVNPPRAGVFRRVVEAICKARPKRVVYVSCNPETLVRDLVLFQQGGFRTDHVQPVDLFPHTPHCEVVVQLRPC